MCRYNSLALPHRRKQLMHFICTSPAHRQPPPPTPPPSNKPISIRLAHKLAEPPCQLRPCRWDGNQQIVSKASSELAATSRWPGLRPGRNQDQTKPKCAALRPACRSRSANAAWICKERWSTDVAMSAGASTLSSSMHDFLAAVRPKCLQRASCAARPGSLGFPVVLMCGLAVVGRLAPAQEDSSRARRLFPPLSLLTLPGKSKFQHEQIVGHFNSRNAKSSTSRNDWMTCPNGEKTGREPRDREDADTFYSPEICHGMRWLF